MNIKATDKWHQRYQTWVAIAVAMAIVVSTLLAQTASATPPTGVTPYPIVSGDLENPIHIKFKDKGGFGRGVVVDTITVVKYVVEPGGAFGWHRHGGPVWAVVSEGALTLYHADDPSCTGRTVTAGTAFLDPGIDHVHNARNLGDTPVVVYATFMLPEGGATRIDEPDPGVCPF
jgi:quercetin dioxygenase-like cupin family protein